MERNVKIILRFMREEFDFLNIWKEIGLYMLVFFVRDIYDDIDLKLICICMYVLIFVGNFSLVYYVFN